MEGRSSRWRINAGPRVGALLGLTLLLALACQYFYLVLEHKSLVYHGLEILKVTCFQSIGKSIIQSIEETLLLLLVGVHIVGSVAGKLREMSDILAHHHGSLLQILELLLELDYTLGYMMRSESHLELILADGVGFFMSFYICIPLIRCRAYKLVWSEQHPLSIVALDHLKLLLYSLKPIIYIHRLDRLRESRRLGPLKVSKSISWRRWWRLVLNIMHVDHGLEHLSLHHQDMLQGRWRFDSIVVLGVGVAVPCVGHLDKQERGGGERIGNSGG
jgi:hypothetical protein